MRFKGTSQSGKDKEIEVYNFTIGQSELIILRDILNYLQRVVPQSFFNMPFNARVRDMRQKIEEVCRDHDIKTTKKRIKNWNPENPNEVL